MTKPLKVVLFGATGMVGHAVLHECLQNPDVAEVLSVSRRSKGLAHPKYRELLHEDLFDLRPVAEQLTGFDACFFTVGVSSAGMKEADYARTTFDLTKAVVDVLLPLNPGLAIVFVSGRSTDSSEQGPVMWARIKGRAENLLLGMPFGSVVIIRLAGLVPAPGGSTSTPLYRFFYGAAAAILPLLHKLFPRFVTTPEILGRAFIRAAQGRAPKKILESPDIHALGSAP
ncbi:MAG TPA: NAD-dependent epimerase/dehydratase family protein [Polyangiales bacterium]|nr:NAD-dependent epimerase/dehydratase family protein [Polyangiales bacterium]